MSDAQSISKKFYYLGLINYGVGMLLFNSIGLFWILVVAYFCRKAVKGVDNLLYSHFSYQLKVSMWFLVIFLIVFFAGFIVAIMNVPVGMVLLVLCVFIILGYLAFMVRGMIYLYRRQVI